MKSLISILLFVILFFRVEYLMADTSLDSEWLNNKIGMESIVLPGFETISVDDKSLGLSAGREYRWVDQILPSEIKAKNLDFVIDNFISVKVDGVYKRIKLGLFEVVDDSGDSVKVKAVSEVFNDVEVVVFFEVEYDGLVMADLRIKPLKGKAEIDRLSLNFNIKGNDWTRMMLFDEKSIVDRYDNIAREPVYHGAFKNAIALTDGDKSFWLFQDNAKGWLGDINNVLHVDKYGSTINVQQSLISSKSIIESEKSFLFNFMVGPLNNKPQNVRRNRPSNGNGVAVGKYHGLSLWWTTAFIHQLLPYTEMSTEFSSLMTGDDRKIYPGVIKTKQFVENYSRYRIKRLPYFSAHVLNYMDPVYQEYREEWEIQPRIVWNTLKYDNPYSMMRNDSFLGLRNRSYQDYLLFRFSKIVDEIGVKGFYFDQGGVRPDKNPEHSLWIDSSGRERASTEILAMRKFYKRLATMLYLKTGEYNIVSHNSKVPLLPAYSFVSAMLQGEEFNHSLIDFDYIKSVSVDEVRTRLAGVSNGIPSIWLEMIFSSNNRLDHSKRSKSYSQSEWQKSDEYFQAYKKFMALALLHDIPTWSVIDINKRNRVLGELKEIEVDDYKFVGYWSYYESEADRDMLASYYIKDDHIVFVVSNLSEHDREIYAHDLLKKYVKDCLYRNNEEYLVLANDFKIINVYCSAET